MSRAPYNTTCDLYYGPGQPGGIAGLKYATALPCRLVKQDDIAQQAGPDRRSRYWMTIALPLPNYTEYTGVRQYVYTADWSFSDQVAIPTGSATRFVASRPEKINLPDGTSYGRVLLIPLPFPVPPPPPPPPPPPALNFDKGSGSNATIQGLTSAGAYLLYAASVDFPGNIAGWSVINVIGFQDASAYIGVYARTTAPTGSIALPHPSVWVSLSLLTGILPQQVQDSFGNSFAHLLNAPQQLDQFSYVTSMAMFKNEPECLTVSNGGCQYVGTLEDDETDVWIALAILQSLYDVPSIAWAWDQTTDYAMSANSMPFPPPT